MASAIHTSRGGTPFGRTLRYRIQAIKFYVAVCRICRGRPLTSQTAFGGQLPYKGSLVRPVARFHHIPFEYNGRLLRATSHYFFHEPRVARSDVVNLNLLPRIGNVHRIHAGRPLGVPYKCGLRGRQAPILFSLSSRGRFRRPGRRTRCCGPGH